MSKLLQLTGVETWTSPLVNNDQISKGDVIRVSDDVGGKIGGHQRVNSEGQPVYYFTQPSGDFKLKKDYTQEEGIPAGADGVSAVPAGPAKVSISGEAPHTPSQKEEALKKTTIGDMDASLAGTLGHGGDSSDTDSVDTSALQVTDPTNGQEEDDGDDEGTDGEDDGAGEDTGEDKGEAEEPQTTQRVKPAPKPRARTTAVKKS